MSPTRALPELSPRDRGTLLELLAREAGLVFGAGLEPRLADSAERAAREVGAAGATDVIARARGGERRAIDALVSAALVGESWFFRDLPRLALVRDHVVPAALAQRGRARLWSAACAAGEEAWSLAAMALSAPGASASRIEVLGTDIDERALARARAGIYRPWSLRHVPDELRERWLEPVAGGFRVRDALRGVVAFDRVNLLEVAAGTAPPLRARWDAIFCRNVLMYLAPELSDAILLGLAEALEEGGALVLGATEPAPPAELASWVAPALGGNVLVRPAAVLPPAVVEPAHVAPPAPRPRASELPGASPSRDPVLEALALADRGEIEPAIDLLAAHDADARALAARALLLESVDRVSDAAASAERALVLDATRVDAAIVAARSRARLGDPVAARRHVHRARRAAARLPRDATLELLPDTSRATLLALVDGIERGLGAPDERGRSREREERW